ncbi:hypothetical protein JMJ35_003805 [Cladonia borealis]|uniref:Uncharacterized protein n=1 Tax=Cladonia borealis TaxID=184061 RepID=A0AA39R389_9LECA|nr:hypothetical protein JMJ35_003805 [Cladonia borealis]
MIPTVNILFGTLFLLRQAISLGPFPASHQHITALTLAMISFKFAILTLYLRIGFYQTFRFIGTFTSPTGPNPWLNVTGSINNRQELSPLYSASLCDIDVFQFISMPTPTPGVDPGDWGGRTPRLHRSCPPEIGVGWAMVSSPPIPQLLQSFDTCFLASMLV